MAREVFVDVSAPLSSSYPSSVSAVYEMEMTWRKAMEESRERGTEEVVVEMVVEMIARLSRFLSKP